MCIEALTIAVQAAKNMYSPEEFARLTLIGFGIKNPTWEEIGIYIKTGEVHDTENGEILYIPPTNYLNK